MGLEVEKNRKKFDFFKMSPKCLKSVWGCRKRNLVKFCCVFRSVDAFFVDFLVCGWCEMWRQGWVSGSRGRKKTKIFDFFKMSPKYLKSVWGCRKRDLVKFCCVFRSVDAFFVDF